MTNVVNRNNRGSKSNFFVDKSAKDGRREILVTACQIDIILGEVESNFEKISAIISKQATLNQLNSDGMESDRSKLLPQLFVFPECALTGYGFSGIDEVRAAAELCKTYLEKLLALCGEYGVYAIVGYVEYISSTTMHNSAAVLCPEEYCGTIDYYLETHNYRKMHLPNMGVDAFDEVIASEDGFTVFTLPFANIGLIICYDHGFPESSRILALNGAELIVAIVNWGEGLTGADIVQARAIDNGVAYMALNRVGEEAGDTYVGQSSLVDCNGNVMLRLGEQEQIVTTVVSFGTGGGIENGEHPMNNRRASDYSDLVRQ